MRRLFILFFFVISSCGVRQHDRSENDGRADSTLKAINRNLELVNQKQGIISVTSRETESLTSIADNRRIQNRIGGNIELIDSVMSDQRLRLLSQQRLLGINRHRIGTLEQQVAGLERTIDQKQHEIDSLRKALAHTSNIAATLHDSLRTAYVLAAPQDSLAKWKIIEKKGGILGFFGSTWRLSGHIPLKRFTRVNMLKTNRIGIPAKEGNFKVMTLHNQNSYSIRNNQAAQMKKSRKTADSSVIVINRPGAFWSASHILVIKLPK